VADKLTSIMLIRHGNTLYRVLPPTVLLLLAVFLLHACGGAPAKYPRSGKSYVIKGKRYHILSSAHGYSEKGVASWYGKYFHGRKTASGERYNMYDMTAAHKTLPLGTWVEVQHLGNGRKITVRINDRGPFSRGRIIDLSYAAASKLNMANAGVATVRVTALGVAAKRKVGRKVETVLVQPKSYDTGRFAVQVASLQDPAKANALASRMRKQFGSASVTEFDRGDALFYRVQVGDNHTMAKALAMQARLEQMGFDGCFVVAR
jgi:rare lipoprotein A